MIVLSIYKGQNLSVGIFGESHGTAIGALIEGLPAGEKLSFEALTEFLERRAPGRNRVSTGRREGDIPRFLSGIIDGRLEGTPVCAVIENSDNRSSDYDKIKHTPRPGHGDFGAYLRYGGYADMRGGGHFSGRLTAPLCIAGGIAKQILERRGIFIASHAASIAGIYDQTFEETGYNKDLINYGDITVINSEAAIKMEEAVLAAKAEGDSVGGTVECMVSGMPPGIGAPLFDGIESRLSYILFGIPAVKGVEFGNGFEAAKLRGSENNDAFCYKDGRAVTRTNRHGGILGGISTGMPIVFTAAIKPTPTISKEQQTIDLALKKDAVISPAGRHDPCIVPRALPAVESAAAIAILDLLL